MYIAIEDAFYPQIEKAQKGYNIIPALCVIEGKTGMKKIDIRLDEFESFCSFISANYDCVGMYSNDRIFPILRSKHGKYNAIK